jgi:cold shock CspA family protein
MKDSFGFIEREDALKEIFFHITEFGPNIAMNSIQPGLEVEFDIQDRHVSFHRLQSYRQAEQQKRRENMSPSVSDDRRMIHTNTSTCILRANSCSTIEFVDSYLSINR